MEFFDASDRLDGEDEAVEGLLGLAQPGPLRFSLPDLPHRRSSPTNDEERHAERGSASRELPRWDVVDASTGADSRDARRLGRGVGQTPALDGLLPIASGSTPDTLGHAGRAVLSGSAEPTAAVIIDRRELDALHDQLNAKERLLQQALSEVEH